MKKVIFSFTLKPENVDRLTQIAEAAGMSRSTLMDLIIETWTLLKSNDKAVLGMIKLHGELTAMQAKIRLESWVEGGSHKP